MKVEPDLEPAPRAAFRDGYGWFTAATSRPHALWWHVAKLNGPRSKCGAAAAPRNRTVLEVPGDVGQVCQACLQAVRAMPPERW